jgi:hypothetical protein
MGWTTEFVTGANVYMSRDDHFMRPCGAAEEVDVQGGNRALANAIHLDTASAIAPLTIHDHLCAVRLDSTS